MVFRRVLTVNGGRLLPKTSQNLGHRAKSTASVETMSWGALSDHCWTGEAPLAAESTKETFVSEAAASGLLLIDVARPRPALRGRLALVVEGAIERALESRGAPPPDPSVPPDRTASLDDLMRRAQVSGATGIAVWFPSLEGIAVAGALDSEDSGTLRWWISAASERPVRVAFDPVNLEFSVYLAPVTLGSLLADAAHPIDERENAPIGSSREEAGAPDETEEPSSEDDSLSFDDDSADEGSAPDSSLADSARRMAETLESGGDTGWLRDALLELSTPPPHPVLAAPSSSDDEPPATDDDDLSVPPPQVAPRLDLRFADAEPALLGPAAVRVEVDAETRRQLESCARELRAASGPKPLAVVERLFVNAYVPLRAALDGGADLPALREAADEWAKNFEKSYLDAFDALRVRVKRPTMVVDAPDIALRVGRLHGARATQLLLVDALRYDLGDRVNERLRAIVGQRAACAERFLLWAALPTTTAAQLELIGRGAAGLREFTGEVTEEQVVARGRKASMIRRLKTGHREVLKLDVVEARLAEPGGADPATFDSMADEVAQRIAAHFEGLQPRTLVMVFGDHGFVLEPDGPRAARSGGASPEEVLVPAFAWLVGAVH
jgi:hypothetical protein